MSELTLIIPTACDPEGLSRTLRSLSGQVNERSRILVVNDGAHPEISNVVAGHSADELKLAENRGSYFARNAGIRASKTPWLGFIDAGVEVCPDWVDHARTGLSSYGYITGPVHGPPPDLRNPTEIYQALYSFPVGHYLKHEGYGPTANLCVRREVVEAVGEFDERLTSGGDKEFGGRVRKWSATSQWHDPNRWVMHEYRSFEGLRKKAKRAAIGARQLASLKPGDYRTISLLSKRGLSYLLPPPYLRLLLGSHRRPMMTAGGHPFPLGDVSALDRLRVYLIAYRLRLLSLFPGVDATRRADSIEWVNGRPINASRK